MAADNQHPDKLSVREKISYGIGDIGNALAVSSVSFWLLIYLTDVAGLGASLAGIAMMIGRTWDALSDPVVGWVSDNTESRWGKRRPFLLFCAIPYAIFYALLWMVPGFEEELSVFIYVTIVLILFNTCFALIIVPYASLTAAMTNDYNERLSLTGFRMVASQSSFLVGAALPSALVLWVTSPTGGEAFFKKAGLDTTLGSIFGSWIHTPRQGYAMMAVIFALIMVASFWTCFRGIRERAPLHKHNPIHHSANPFSYIAAIVKQFKTNKPFRMAVSILCLSELGAALVAINLPFFVRYVLDLEVNRTTILLCLFAGAIAAIPFWTYIGKRYGKSETYKIVVRCYAVVLVCLAFVPAGSVYLAHFVAVCGGVCHAAALMIPWSMIPDVVEYDELQSGDRREGLFYGGALFSYKLATAVGVLLSGTALDLIGYVPNQEQGSSTMLGMRAVISVAPSLFLLTAAWVASRYPLTAAKHHDIVAELQRKREQ